MIDRKRLKLARCVGRASQIESQGGSCVPTSVAFTHGYSSDEFKMGLHPGPVLAELIRGSKELAEKHREDLQRSPFYVIDKSQVSAEIEKNLGTGRAGWVTYRHDDVNHMIGLLTNEAGGFNVWNLAGSERGQRMNAVQVAQIITDNQKDRELQANMFSFSKLNVDSTI